MFKDFLKDVALTTLGICIIAAVGGYFFECLMLAALAGLVLSALHN